MTPGLFITATGTGMGKTVATAVIGLGLQQMNLNVGFMKPFASGCAVQEGELVSEDVVWLQQMLQVADPPDLVNPIRYAAPLAPLVAGRLEGRFTSGEGRFTSGADSHASGDLETCARAFRILCERHEVVLVEGIGGLLVPLAPNPAGGCFTGADLAARLGIGVLVVSARTLGSIHHALATAWYPLPAPAHYAGWLFNDAAPLPADDVSISTNAGVIAELTGLPLWGQLPLVPALTRESMRQLTGSLNWQELRSVFSHTHPHPTT